MRFPTGSAVKNPPAIQKTQEMPRVPSLGQEAPLEESMTNRCSVLTWRIPRIEEPHGLQPSEWHRVGHDGND